MCQKHFWFGMKHCHMFWLQINNKHWTKLWGFYLNIGVYEQCVFLIKYIFVIYTHMIISKLIIYYLIETVNTNILLYICFQWNWSQVHLFHVGYSKEDKGPTSDHISLKEWFSFLKQVFTTITFLGVQWGWEILCFNIWPA